MREWLVGWLVYAVLYFHELIFLITKGSLIMVQESRNMWDIHYKRFGDFP